MTKNDETAGRVRIEVGKKYVCRDRSDVEYVEIIRTIQGNKADRFVGIIQYRANDQGVITCGEDGKYFESDTTSCNDLVAEWRKRYSETVDVCLCIEDKPMSVPFVQVYMPGRGPYLNTIKVLKRETITLTEGD